MIQNGIGWLMLSRASLAEARNLYRCSVKTQLIEPNSLPESEFLATIKEHREREVSVLHAKDLLMGTAHWNASMVSALIPVPEGHRRLLGVGVHGPTSRITDKAEMICSRLLDLVEEVRAQS
ncbi:hypothetical protein [Sulfitobacter geojensis]|jgi:DNA-binding IclR family transcriptional regulator|nr:hypothetical protein [Sulfitobacter geojensis]|tara:strand:+ start:7684 stop:8049 length:366 start_codon:yes stop_codon:yes gene_type:complete